MGIISQISPTDFEGRLRNFPRDYMLDFNVFWRWRLRVEGAGGHILDRRSLGEAHKRLVRVLGCWQAYRVKGLKHKWRDTLRKMLADISDAYDEVRGRSLLEFDRISQDTLRLVWDGLGCVKEADGAPTKGGEYYVIAVCKPLMLIWGQTLAFDSRVRRAFPLRYGTLRHHRWTFDRWMRVMKRVQTDLLDNPVLVSRFEELAKEKYGIAQPTPFGRFLDIYYFGGGNPVA